MISEFRAKSYDWCRQLSLTRGTERCQTCGWWPG